MRQLPLASGPRASRVDVRPLAAAAGGLLLLALAAEAATGPRQGVPALQGAALQGAALQGAALQGAALGFVLDRRAFGFGAGGASSPGPARSEACTRSC